MIAFDLEGHRFQLRAAAVIVHDGAVLLHRLEGDTYWSLPGGRVEPGEDGASTLVREIREELNEVFECGALRYVVEDFFSIDGRPMHEIGLYFSGRMAEGSAVSSRADSHFGIEGDQRLEFRWFDVSRLAGMDVRPSFLAASLAEPTTEIRHIVQRY